MDIPEFRSYIPVHEIAKQREFVRPPHRLVNRLAHIVHRVLYFDRPFREPAHVFSVNHVRSPSSTSVFIITLGLVSFEYLDDISGHLRFQSKHFVITRRVREAFLQPMSGS